METEIIEIKNTEQYFKYARIRDYLITSLMLSTRVLEKELVFKLCKDSGLFNYFLREGAELALTSLTSYRYQLNHI